VSERTPCFTPTSHHTHTYTYSYTHSLPRRRNTTGWVNVPAAALLTPCSHGHTHTHTHSFTRTRTFHFVVFEVQAHCDTCTQVCTEASSSLCTSLCLTRNRPLAHLHAHTRMYKKHFSSHCVSFVWSRTHTQSLASDVQAQMTAMEVEWACGRSTTITTKRPCCTGARRSARGIRGHRWLQTTFTMMLTGEEQAAALGALVVAALVFALALAVVEVVAAACLLPMLRMVVPPPPQQLILGRRRGSRLDAGSLQPRLAGVEVPCRAHRVGSLHPSRNSCTKRECNTWSGTTEPSSTACASRLQHPSAATLLFMHMRSQEATQEELLLLLLQCSATLPSTHTSLALRGFKTCLRRTCRVDHENVERVTA
jgi:hypothetical protein